MYIKTNNLGTLQTAPMIHKKEDSPPVVSECLTRMMTPEDWEKYGPLNRSESKKVCSHRRRDPHARFSCT
jgi:hypothetical protein